ncbi:hypothetical protein JS278_02970 [Acidipropionibacterium virtanenii]|uniref:Uncharacterized protein n=1 Tax=Acidipropionibacterium virtanenii TaxID=2057246 RepID=A0A344UXV6_9ACTN|nr:hypothetical protein JS278_02970 [Acidipropionibacterium virtanenii]
MAASTAVVFGAHEAELAATGRALAQWLVNG